MQLTPIVFWIVAGLTALCALSVVVNQNIVRAAAMLLFTLAGVSGLFFLLGADFVGATQLIVYVGGTLILVVFGVMLTAQGPFISMKTGAAEWAIATVVGLLFAGVLIVSLVGTTWPDSGPKTVADAGSSMNSVVIGESLLGVTDATPTAPLTGLKNPNMPERTKMSYLLPFEVVSVHLLVVLIGAAYLARAKRRRSVSSPALGEV